MDFKKISSFWRLSDPLTVEQAAALIAGFDPNSVDSNGEYFKNRETGQTDSDGIKELNIIFSALMNAINARKLKATIRRSAWARGWDEDPGDGERFESKVTILEDDALEAWEANPTYAQRRGIIYRVSPDWGLTTVTVDDLRVWLITRGIRPHFFFPEVTNDPDYLNPNNPRYAPKLAAAIKVWQAMEDDNLLRGKPVKKAMQEWLESRYRDLGLVWNGKINREGIDQIVKVANWNDGGGAPKTPGE